ncbi:glycosyltransferase [Bradyrhizobium sp. AZCC 2289]|uniref:glycosyltransferase n=1 Tax=Bradyrhizobium sp. AZCC 2289 TaxID=3117026 RepID=UPI002FF35266
MHGTARCTVCCHRSGRKPARQSSEAMASGKAVVASDVGGMPDLVDPGETGLLVPPGDPQALAHAMQRLLEDRALRARLEATSFARIGRLKAGTVVTRIERVYRDVLRPATGGAALPAPQGSGEPSCR